MKKLYGFDRLESQTLGFVSEMIEQFRDEAVGDSEIEKLLIVALHARALVGASEYTNIVRVSTAEEEGRILAFAINRVEWSNADTPAGPAAAASLYIRPQAQIGSRRADFLIHALDWRDMENRKWRRLIVECDGHDFHERTKEQAKRDRSRDRQAVLDGYDAFRFTGSELWNDPWGCAEQITDWAVKGWGF